MMAVQVIYVLLFYVLPIVLQKRNISEKKLFVSVFEIL